MIIDKIYWHPAKAKGILPWVDWSICSRLPLMLLCDMIIRQ